MQDTKKYKVTQTNTLGKKVGDFIELTDRQALALVNKVELVKEPVKPVEVKKAKAKKAK